MMKNIKKTYYYLKRNGIVPTYYAAKERLEERKSAYYSYQEISDEDATKQIADCKGRELPLISILVPAFRTPGEYLRELLASVQAQTYPNWELILADASDDDSVRQVLADYKTCDRIRYISLAGNDGISGNSNAGLAYCQGKYTALLDHDDLLTRDALYEMYQQVEDAPILVYSDEDKCDETGNVFFDVHHKKNFDYDLFLTNNYICHFTMIETDIMKQMQFRKEYDGAQDFDLFLRVVQYAIEHERSIRHVPKVLYHWRCHTGSTSENPQSKAYAYEAGMRAVQAHLEARGIRASVSEARHVGFYEVNYLAGIFAERPEVGAIAPKRAGRKYLQATFYEEDGTFPFDQLPKHYGGYLHRANLSQEVYAADVTTMEVRPELQTVVNKLIEQYQAEGLDTVAVSMKVAGYLHEQGYICVYQPKSEHNG